MSLLLNRETIRELVTMEEAVEILERAFGELASGTSEMPQRVAVTDADHNGWYAFMPAQLKSMGALGIKAVTVYKDNPSKHNLPSTLATIIPCKFDRLYNTISLSTIWASVRVIFWAYSILATIKKIKI